MTASKHPTGLSRDAYLRMRRPECCRALDCGPEHASTFTLADCWLPICERAMDRLLSAGLTASDFAPIGDPHLMPAGHYRMESRSKVVRGRLPVFICAVVIDQAKRHVGSYPSWEKGVSACVHFRRTGEKLRSTFYNRLQPGERRGNLFKRVRNGSTRWDVRGMDGNDQTGKISRLIYIGTADSEEGAKAIYDRWIDLGEKTRQPPRTKKEKSPKPWKPAKPRPMRQPKAKAWRPRPKPTPEPVKPSFIKRPPVDLTSRKFQPDAETRAEWMWRVVGSDR